MAADIKVPTLGESVTTATVARWLKKAGEQVAADEALVELETDKVTVEVNAPSAGTLGALVAEEGAEVEVGAVLGTIEEAAARRPRQAAQHARVVLVPGQAAAAGVNPAAARRPGGAAGDPAGGRRPPTPDAGRGQADGGEQPVGRTGRRRLRQGWPDHQGRRAGVPEPPGRAAAAPPASAGRSRRRRARSG